MRVGSSLVFTAPQAWLAPVPRKSLFQKPKNCISSPISMVSPFLNHMVTDPVSLYKRHKCLNPVTNLPVYLGTLGK